MITYSMLKEDAAGGETTLPANALNVWPLYVTTSDPAARAIFVSSASVLVGIRRYATMYDPPERKYVGTSSGSSMPQSVLIEEIRAVVNARAEGDPSLPITVLKSPWNDITTMEAFAIVRFGYVESRRLMRSVVFVVAVVTTVAFDGTAAHTCRLSGHLLSSYSWHSLSYGLQQGCFALFASWVRRIIA